MFSLNRAQIVGNVTRDPELRYTPNGQAVCSFGVATNRRWRDKDGNNQEQAEFHNIVSWGKLAELMGQLVHKGTKIYLEGRLQTRSWEGQDGGKRNRTEIVMDDFIVFTPKGAIPSEPSADIEEFPASASSDTNLPAGKAGATEDKKATTGMPTEEKEKPEKIAKDEEKPTKKAKEETEEDEINLDDIPF